MKETRIILLNVFLKSLFLICVFTICLLVVNEVKDWQTARNSDKEYQKDLLKHKYDSISPITRGIHIKSDTLKK